MISCFKDVKVIDFLIENGALVNHIDKWGRTPLHLAVNNGRVQVVKSLIRTGAHVNATDNDLNTPLHYVNSVEDIRSILEFRPTCKDFYSIAELLIQIGADVHAKNANGRTPFDIITNEKSKFLIYLHEIIEIIYKK